MAENSGASTQSSSKGLLIVLLVLVFLMMAGMGAALFFMFKNTKTAASSESHGAETTGAAHPGVLVEVPAIVVNLNHSMEEIRYLKCTINVQVADEKVAEKVNAGMPRVKNEAILYLSTLRFQDIQSLEDKQKIIHNLQEKIDEALGGKVIQKIFLTEFVVQ